MVNLLRNNNKLYNYFFILLLLSFISCTKKPVEPDYNNPFDFNNPLTKGKPIFVQTHIDSNDNILINWNEPDFEDIKYYNI